MSSTLHTTSVKGIFYNATTAIRAVHRSVHLLLEGQPSYITLAEWFNNLQWASQARAS